MNIIKHEPNIVVPEGDEALPEVAPPFERPHVSHQQVQNENPDERDDNNAIHDHRTSPKSSSRKTNHHHHQHHQHRDQSDLKERIEGSPKTHSKKQEQNQERREHKKESLEEAAEKSPKQDHLKGQKHLKNDNALHRKIEAIEKSPNTRTKDHQNHHSHKHDVSHKHDDHHKDTGPPRSPSDRESDHGTPKTNRKRSVHADSDNHSPSLDRKSHAANQSSAQPKRKSGVKRHESLGRKDAANVMASGDSNLCSPTSSPDSAGGEKSPLRSSPNTSRSNDSPSRAKLKSPSSPPKSPHKRTPIQEERAHHLYEFDILEPKDIIVSSGNLPSPPLQSRAILTVQEVDDGEDVGEKESDLKRSPLTIYKQPVQLEARAQVQPENANDAAHSASRHVTDVTRTNTLTNSSSPPRTIPSLPIPIISSQVTPEPRQSAASRDQATSPWTLLSVPFADQWQQGTVIMDDQNRAHFIIAEHVDDAERSRNTMAAIAQATCVGKGDDYSFGVGQTLAVVTQERKAMTPTFRIFTAHPSYPGQVHDHDNRGAPMHFYGILEQSSTGGTFTFSRAVAEGEKKITLRATSFGVSISKLFRFHPFLGSKWNFTFRKPGGREKRLLRNQHDENLLIAPGQDPLIALCIAYACDRLTHTHDGMLRKVSTP